MQLQLPLLPDAPRPRAEPRALLKPQEMVRIFMEAVRCGWASGLFLTTGDSWAAEEGDGRSAQKCSRRFASGTIIAATST